MKNGNIAVVGRLWGPIQTKLNDGTPVVNFKVHAYTGKKPDDSGYNDRRWFACHYWGVKRELGDKFIDGAEIEVTGWLGKTQEPFSWKSKKDNKYHPADILITATKVKVIDTRTAE